MRETFSQEARRRLFTSRNKSFPEFSDYDNIAIQHAISQLESHGATVDEVIAYIRCFEEYDPEIDEATALATMNKIHSGIEARTGKKFNIYFVE